MAEGLMLEWACRVHRERCGPRCNLGYIRVPGGCDWHESAIWVREDWQGDALCVDCGQHWSHLDSPNRSLEEAGREQWAQWRVRVHELLSWRHASTHERRSVSQLKETA